MLSGRPGRRRGSQRSPSSGSVPAWPPEKDCSKGPRLYKTKRGAALPPLRQAPQERESPGESEKTSSFSPSPDFPFPGHTCSPCTFLIICQITEIHSSRHYYGSPTSRVIEDGFLFNNMLRFGTPPIDRRIIRISVSVVDRGCGPRLAVAMPTSVH